MSAWEGSVAQEAQERAARESGAQQQAKSPWGAKPTDDVSSPAFDIHVRLAALKAEHDKGRALIESLDAQRAAVARGLVKVEGAMELLLEMGAKVEEKP